MANNDSAHGLMYNVKMSPHANPMGHGNLLYDERHD